MGGERFAAQRNYLLRWPTTRLGKLMRAASIQVSMMMASITQRILELCDEFVPGDPPEYFFDKNPENFHSILELHRFRADKFLQIHFNEQEWIFPHL